MQLFNPYILFFRGKKRIILRTPWVVLFLTYNPLFGIEKDDIGPENTYSMG